MGEGTGPSSRDPISWAITYWEDQDIPEASTMLLFTSLARAYQTWLDEVEGILKPLGLGFTRYLALLALMTSKDRALPLNQVSSLILVHPTTITVIIDQLEKSGLVERLPHPTDRRVRLAALTDAGAEATEIASRELGERNFGMPSLNKRKLESAVKFLTEIRELAGDAEPRASRR